jgi:hypothetical protein
MERSASVSALRSDFDDFLFAPISEDGNGTVLSVLSALARLDFDPWEEAANLAQMPKETATRKLASLIAALPDGPSARPDPGMIAPRLIALLPRRAASTLPGVGAVAHSPAVAYVIYYVIFTVIVLVGQWLMASRQAPAQLDKAPAVASVLPQPPPQNSGE